MRGKSIVLIGFMGAGKSSTGAALAKQTGLPRFDTDELVSKRLGLAVPEIFKTLGEEAFRDSETRALSGLANSETGIIITGGGIVLRPDNVKMLRTLGTVVFLETNVETLFRRVSEGAPRPLLQSENPRSTLQELLRVREPLYREAADMQVDTTTLTPNEVADSIVRSLAQL